MTLIQRIYALIRAIVFINEPNSADEFFWLDGVFGYKG